MVLAVAQYLVSYTISLAVYGSQKLHVHVYRHLNMRTVTQHTFATCVHVHVYTGCMCTCMNIHYILCPSTGVVV